MARERIQLEMFPRLEVSPPSAAPRQTRRRRKKARLIYHQQTITEYLAKMVQSPFLHYNGEAPYVAGSETSKEAAKSMAGSASAIRERVYSYIASRMAVGATCDEVEVALQMSHQTISARCRELVLQNRIFKLTDPTTGKAFRRKTRSDRNADVLYARLY